jgi:hypothetical protein
MGFGLEEKSERALVLFDTKVKNASLRYNTYVFNKLGMLLLSILSIKCIKKEKHAIFEILFR